MGNQQQAIEEVVDRQQRGGLQLLAGKGGFRLGQNQLWQATFDAVQDVLFVIDRSFTIVLANRMAQEAFPHLDIIGQKCFKLFHNTDHPNSSCPGCQVFHSGCHASEQRQETVLDGEWYEVSAHPMKDEGGFVWYSLHIFRDISRERELSKRLEQLETRDSHTSLLNMRHFNEAFAREFELASRRYSDLVLLVIELDELKKVNEECGLHYGDFIIKEFAHELQGRVRHTDLCARLGGERFAVLLPDANLQEGEMIARNIHAMAESHVYDASCCRQVTVSIGVASFIEHQASTMDDLFFFAENSMRAAKRGGRNRIIIYDAEKLV